MTQKNKIDQMIKEMVKEELEKSTVEEAEKEFITTDGTKKTATPEQKKQMATVKPGDTVSFKKAGAASTMESLDEEMAEQRRKQVQILARELEQKYNGDRKAMLNALQGDLETLEARGQELGEEKFSKLWVIATSRLAAFGDLPRKKKIAADKKAPMFAKGAKATRPEDTEEMNENSEEMQIEENTQEITATEVAGSLAEILDKLKTMSEAGEDAKKTKLSQKAMKQIEIAQSVLEELAQYEVSLSEKDEERRIKDAGKKRKMIEKYLKKSIKMPEVVERLMKKLPDAKIAEMLKKSPDLDEQKVAGAMMKVALKESMIPTTKTK